MLTVHAFTAQNSSLLEQFRAFPAQLYVNDAYWLSSPEVYPETVVQFFLVIDEHRIIGRACAMVNPEIHDQNQPTGLVGFYECEDTAQAATVLLNAVKQYFKSAGMTVLIGPMNGSTWQKYRLTLPSKNPPFFLDNYHKPWYHSQFEAAGFEPIAKYSSTEITVADKPYSRLKAFEADRSQAITIRSFNRADFETDLRAIYTVSIASFQDNFLYTPLSFETFLAQYVPVKAFMNPQFVLIAEDAQAQPVGFVFAVDNLFDKTEKTLIAKTMAVLPSLRSKGLGTVLLEKIHQTAFNAGYTAVFHALMVEANVSSKILAEGSQPYQTYQLMGMPL
jgi:GNAT superfamily N-acetyltransferase